MTRKCASCDKEGATKRCSGCRSVFYCGKACQLSHWKQGHKRECKRANSNVADTNAGCDADPAASAAGTPGIRPRVFLSYAWEKGEQAGVDDLERELNKAGLHVVRDTHSREEARDDIGRWMADNIDEASDAVVVVVTPGYKEKYLAPKGQKAGQGVRFEMRLVTTLVRKERAHRVFVVLMRGLGASSGHVPFPLQSLWTYNFPADQAALVSDLLKQPREMETRLRDERRRVTTFRVPARSKLFEGREADVEAVWDALHDVGARVALSAVRGMGGVGKTVLAAEIANLYCTAGERDLVAWLSASSVDECRAELVDLGKRLDCVKDGMSGRAVVEAVHVYLEGNPGWLLVFDNAEDVEEIAALVPPRGGRVLITSRTDEWTEHAPVRELGVLSAEAGVQLLEAKSERSGDDGARELVMALGCLPLAIDQMGALMRVRKWSAATCLEEFRVREAKLLATTAYKKKNKNELTVATVFHSSLQASQERADMQKQLWLSGPLLVALSYLAPERVPRAQLDVLMRHVVRSVLGSDEAVAAWEREMETSVQEALEEALGELNELALVKLEDEWVSVHRMVSAAMRRAHKREGSEVVGVQWSLEFLHGLVDALCDMYQSHESWTDEAKALAPHLEALLRVMTAEGARPLSDLYAAVGQARKERHELERALEAIRQAKCIYQEELGPEHPSVGDSLNNMAKVYKKHGEYSNALELFERALRIRKAALGPEHPSVGQTLSNVAVVFQRQGDYNKALELSKRALLILETHLGPEHPSVATTLNNMANVFAMQAEYRKALELYEHALRIKQATLGPEHPSVGETLNDMGVVYREQGEYSKAKELHEGALGIYEAALGPDTRAWARR